MKYRYWLIPFLALGLLLLVWLLWRQPVQAPDAGDSPSAAIEVSLTGPIQDFRRTPQLADDPEYAIISLRDGERVEVAVDCGYRAETSPEITPDLKQGDLVVAFGKRISDSRVDICADPTRYYLRKAQ